MIKLVMLFQLWVGIAQPDSLAQKPKLSLHCQSLPFEQFCQQVNAQTGLRVFYVDQWLADHKVTLDADSLPVLEAINKALATTVFKASVYNSNIVILKDLLLPDNEFVQKENITNKPPEALGKEVTATEERYLKGRKSSALEMIRVGKQGLRTNAGKAKIIGRITDAETGEPIIGATLFVEETKSGGATDPSGYVSLIHATGNFSARLECLGYERKTVQLHVLSDGNFVASLLKAVIQMKEVTVYGDKQNNVRLKDAGLEKLTVKTLKEIPSLMGERNLLKVSQMLPGIVSAGEGSAGLNVRGGNADQNAFYINKVPVYNTSHLFGFFPAFNSDVIQDFTIYKGYIPPNFGGRLSSVFSMLTKQGNRKRLGARGGISPISASLAIDGPIIKDMCTFSVSARTSYSDWILGRLTDPMIRQSKAGFNDFSASLNYDANKAQIAVFAYYSHDQFKLAEMTEYTYSNAGASASLGYNFSPDFRGSFSVISSQYEYATIDKQIASSAYSHDYSLQHHELRAEFIKNLTENHTLTFGWNAVLYQLLRGTVQPYGLQSLKTPIVLGSEKGLENALFVSDAYEPIPRLRLNLGLRLGHFTPLGSASVLKYAEGLPMDLRYVTDTIQFASNEPIKWYLQPEFRFSAQYETGENSAVKAAINRMHQNIFMLNNTVSISPNAQWKLADYHISPSAGMQYSLGWFANLPKSNLELSVEGYFKSITDYTEFRDGADFLNTPHVETNVLQGNLKAWGVEVMMKRKAGKVDGWVSYTFSKATVQINGSESWSKINQGKEYPASFDIPHVLNAIANWHIARRLTLSGIFTYQTGKPTTYPIGIYYVNGIPYIDYSSRNAYRIPDYFRADASLTFEGNLKKKKLVHSSLVFSLYNITGRDNPYSIYFKKQNGVIRGYQYSVIGVPLFTVTWLFKFGNYASE